jgi:magnesium chelatase subunit D
LHQDEEEPALRPIDAPPEGLFSAGLWSEVTIRSEPAGTAALEDESPRRDPTRRGRGRGRRTRPSRRPFRGRHARSLPLGQDRPLDLAWDASLRAAALQGGKLRFEDLWRKLRLVRPSRLLLFVVDISGSMGGELTALAQQVALGLLHDAYLRRDRVAVIAFCGRVAELLVPPTDQAALVRRQLAELPCGGTTPLAQGLQLAHDTLARARLRDPARDNTLVLLSDGRANVGRRPGHAAQLAEVEAAARALARQPDLTRVMLDTTAEGQPDLPARSLCEQLDARRVLLWQTGDIAEVIRSRIL